MRANITFKLYFIISNVLCTGDFKNNKNFYYEKLTDNLYIMIDNDTQEVIGVEVLYFIDNKEETLESINKLTINNLKEAILKALKVVKENNSSSRHNF